MLIKADIFLRLSVQSAGEDSQTGVCSVEFQDIIFSQIMLIKADIFSATLCAICGRRFSNWSLFRRISGYNFLTDYAD